MSPSDIREKRLQANLSQEQAASVVYVHPRTWYRYESGESSIPRAVWELFVLRVDAQIDDEPSG